MKSDFLDIDDLNLDKECLKQASLYFRYAKLAADARQSYDEALAGLKVREAELERDIRKYPKRHGLDEKITESAIKAAVTCHSSIKDAMDEIRELKHTLDVHQAAVTAIEHRKSALTLLVNLHGAGYYAEPRIAKKGRDAVEEDVKARVRRPMGVKKSSWKDDEEDQD